MALSVSVMSHNYALPLQYQLRSSEQENMPPLPLPMALPLGADLGFYPLPYVGKDAQLPGAFDNHYYSDHMMFAMFGADGASVPPQALLVSSAASTESLMATGVADARGPCGEMFHMALSAPDASPPATGYLAAPPPPPLSDAGADALPARARARRDAVFVPRELSHAAISQYCSVAYDDTARDGDDRRYSHRPATNGHVAKRRLTTGAAAHAKCYDTHVNRVLYGWLQQNIDNPYPSPQAKLELMKKSGLSKMQLKNWFCNIRRRKLPSSIKHQKPRK